MRTPHHSPNSPPSMTCAVYAMEKQKNTPYRRFSTNRTPNVCGPLTPASRQGFRYLVTYADEGSRDFFEEGLQRKTDTGMTTKATLLKIGTHFHRTVTYFTTDSAEEYLSKQIKSFYKDHGIQTDHPFIARLKKTENQNESIAISCHVHVLSKFCRDCP